MSYGQPGVQGYAPVAAPPRSGGAAALPGLAVVLVLNLVLELALLIFDLNRKGAGYLETAIWNDYHHYVDGVPFGFFPGDTATVIALVVLIIGAFSGKGWVRPAGTVLLLINGYGSAIVVIDQLTSDEGRHAFGSPATNLWLNLDGIVQVLLALVFALVVMVTVSSGPRPAYGPGYAPIPAQPMPMPPAGAPGGAPGFPPPPAQPPGQPPYGYPPNR
ncbi:hypothetical protein LN042_17865 [Kitasatospora sp. RB6PN24]|uniref:hypothetical protein n=1 Tax=Kitasatospora humi TaxID=2893891 RepID=UPI001E340D86|nr:hypothetical protein [Kitasatospora humi]MCC9308931.1 hypothetical protein [Kitasatospora humi]